jgi:hypothetical protein
MRGTKRSKGPPEVCASHMRWPSTVVALGVRIDRWTMRKGWIFITVVELSTTVYLKVCD